MSTVDYLQYCNSYYMAMSATRCLLAGNRLWGRDHYLLQARANELFVARIAI